jgi:hypothetical protein
LIPAAIQAKFFSVAGNAPLTSKHVVPSPGWGSAAIVTLPEGSTQAFSFWLNSAGSGQKLNPSVTVKFPTAWPTQPFLYLCKLIGGNGNLSPIDGESTSLTKTEMTFVYNDLPVAGKNYKIGCMGQ